MFKNLLPVGTVVLLKNGIKKIMIVGIKPINKEKLDETYDYIGVLYPEGYISNEINFLFNHEDINDIVFKGYENPERAAFVDMLEKAYEDSLKVK